MSELNQTVNKLNQTVTCQACGSIYRGAAVEKVVCPGWWTRGVDGVLIQPAQCVCGEKCTLRRPDLGANVILVSTPRGSRPQTVWSTTRTLVSLDDGKTYYRSGPLAGRERGVKFGHSLFTGESAWLEAWALSLGVSA